MVSMCWIRMTEAGTDSALSQGRGRGHRHIVGGGRTGYYCQPAGRSSDGGDRGCPFGQSSIPGHKVSLSVIVYLSVPL